VVSVVTGVLRANARGSPAPARAKTGRSKTRRMPGAFAAPPRPVARLDPADRHERVLPITDDAPWRRGQPIDGALAEHPHLEFPRLPSYSPRPNVVERSWKSLRRRATHNRLFDSLADPERSLRASPCYYQAVRGRIRTPIAGCYTPAQDQSVTTGT